MMSRHLAGTVSVWMVMIAGLPAAAQAPAERPDVTAAETEYVEVGVGQSKVIESAWPVARVSITDTAVADVQVLTPRQVLLTGKAIGTTDLILWSQEERIWHATVKVVVDLSYIGRELDRLFPDADLAVRQSEDLLMIEGRLRRAVDVEHLHRVLDAYGVRYIDATRVAGVHQVLLHVRVAEVSRTAIRALGVNAFYASDSTILGLTFGPDGGGPLNPISIGVPGGTPVGGTLPFSFLDDVGVSSGISFFGAFPDIDFQLFLQALEENQYVRLLAEPTLVALSGEEATFLAGGEFPVPVVQGGGIGGGGTSISIEYKEFGVRLRFRPVVLGDGTIRLEVSPEVSELSDFGAVEIEGFRIPTVLTRRASTTLELKSGQTFIIAGLLREVTSARRTRIPILGDLPVIGPLFRSVRYETGETELVVMATASLVEPSSSTVRRPLPGDLHVEPNSWELYVNGQIEGRPPPLAPADAAWLREMGLQRLKGPGAWATYDQRPVPLEAAPRSALEGMARPASGGAAEAEISLSED